MSNNLIIIFVDQIGQQLFLSEIIKKNLFTDKKVIELNNKKKELDIVIKGLNYKSFDNYKYILATSGITKIFKLNKSNDNFRMIKAECIDSERKEKLIKEGLKIDHFILKVEEYNKPIKPLQCFYCQLFGHIANNCPSSDKPTCLKCGGNHKVENCISNDLKCVNCNQEHTSIYKMCPVYQVKLDEKMKKLATATNKAQPTNIRLYSQAIGNQNDLEAIKNIIILSMKTNMEFMEKNINDSLRRVHFLPTFSFQWKESGFI